MKEYCERIIRLISDDDLNRVLRQMMSKGIKINGFSPKAKKIPRGLIISRITKHELDRGLFFSVSKDIFEREKKPLFVELINMIESGSNDELIMQCFDEIEKLTNLNKNDNNELEKETGVCDTMKYYIGEIKRSGTYFNFHPKISFNSDDNSFEELDFNTIRELYPQNGTINLGYKHVNDDAHFFLDRIVPFGFIETQESKKLFVLKFTESDLVDNDHEYITKKIELQKLYEDGNAGKNFENVILPLNALDVYKIVTVNDEYENFSFENKIFVNEKHFIKDELVLLECGNDRKLYGPFKLEERSLDGEKYIDANIISNKYIVNYYDESNYEYVPYNEYIGIAHTNDPKEQDEMPNSVLLTKLTESISLDLLYSNRFEFERLYSSSPFLGDGVISESILVSRKNKIKNILKNISQYKNDYKEAIDILIDNIDDDLLNTKIEQSELFLTLKSKNNELILKNDKLDSEYKNLKEKYEALDNDRKNNTISSEDIAELDKLRAENDELKTKIDTKEEYDKLNEKLKETKILYDERVNEKRKKEDEIDKLNNELKSKKKEIRDAIEAALKSDDNQMAHIAFDSYVSNAMFEAAESYRKDSELSNFRDIANEIKNYDSRKYEPNELIEKLVAGVQKFRKYSKNDILNMFICLSQNFLTVFAGEPGTGKTSICNILANSLGLNNFGENKNRYIPISVERGWTSKRDLIGYFNPLTKKYDRNNAKIYDGLMLLNTESEDSKFPFLMLLDEANLSPMEYYWADFMRATDNSEAKVSINIGLDQDIYIPKTLHFLATINNDQTTETLSPRLIDRAWIIKLPKVDIIKTEEKIEEYFKDIISWEDIEKAFVLSSDKEMKEKTVASDIYKLFESQRLSVSPRVKQSIEKYVCVAQEIMDTVGECKKEEIALDYAILQKLLPKINGYYDNYKRLFDELKVICDSNHLKMTKEALLIMEDFKEQNMGYCKYLI